MDGDWSLSVARKAFGLVIGMTRDVSAVSSCVTRADFFSITTGPSSENGDTMCDA